jgi:hypothetical protein
MKSEVEGRALAKEVNKNLKDKNGAGRSMHRKFEGKESVISNGDEELYKGKI